MAFELPPLPYDYAALEPHIDEQTMRIHHGKRHQTYVDKANEALAGTEWEDAPVRYPQTPPYQWTPSARPVDAPVGGETIE